MRQGTGAKLVLWSLWEILWQNYIGNVGSFYNVNKLIQNMINIQ